MSGNDKDQVKNSNEFEANLFIKKIEALRSGSGSALGDFKINVPGHYPGPGTPPYPGKQILSGGVGHNPDRGVIGIGASPLVVPPGGDWRGLAIESPATATAGRYSFEKNPAVTGSVFWKWSGQYYLSGTIISGTLIIKKISLPLIFEARLEGVRLRSIDTPPCIEGEFKTY